MGRQTARISSQTVAYKSSRLCAVPCPRWSRLSTSQRLNAALQVNVFHTVVSRLAEIQSQGKIAPKSNLITFQIGHNTHSYRVTTISDKLFFFQIFCVTHTDIGLLTHVLID